jgi:hypothetical protein
VVVILFYVGLIVASILLYRLTHKAGRVRRDPNRRPGRSDGVRRVYRRGP